MHRIIRSSNAPRAAGPYSLGTYAGPFIFLAGQIAVDPATDKLIEGDITQQTHQVIQNIKAVLQEVDATLANVIKTTIFLADMNDYVVVNQVYGEYFSENPPARSTIQVAALPLGARIEIEMIAFRRPGGSQHGKQ